MLQTVMHESCDASLGTTNEPLRVIENADSVHQIECGPSMFDNVHFMEALNVEDCETPSRFHQSSSVPDATRCATLCFLLLILIALLEDETNIITPTSGYDNLFPVLYSSCSN
jgi:hypothetical protein